jgi:hypothetical protein
MRNLYLTIIFFSTLGGIAQSPITLSNSNMPSSGDTLRYTSVNPTSLGNYTQTGANFSWNFSSVTTTTEGVSSFKSAIQTPYALFFFSFSGFAEKMPDVTIGGGFGFTDYYNFYKKQTSPVQAFIADGVGLTFSSVPLPSYYSDKDELYIFPMSYPKYDSTSFRFSTLSSTLIPIIYSKTGYRVSKVDGWGTVQTPYGTENCLRLVSTQYSKDSIKNNIIPIPIGFANTTRSYQWLTASSKIPYFEVTGTVVGSNFVPTSARFRGYKQKETNLVGISTEAAVSIIVYPNPVKDVIKLSASAEVVSSEIRDLSGKVVLTLQSATAGQEQVIDVSSLAPGIYSLRLQAAAQQYQMRFVKE